MNGVAWSGDYHVVAAVSVHYSLVEMTPDLTSHLGLTESINTLRASLADTAKTSAIQPPIEKQRLSIRVPHHTKKLDQL